MAKPGAEEGAGGGSMNAATSAAAAAPTSELAAAGERNLILKNISFFFIFYFFSTGGGCWELPQSGLSSGSRHELFLTAPRRVIVSPRWVLVLLTTDFARDGEELQLDGG